MNTLRDFAVSGGEATLPCFIVHKGEGLGQVKVDGLTAIRFKNDF